MTEMSMGDQKQKGMASFLVTLIMLLVTTLIIVGFTQLNTQNGRQALDRQLSNQAFYAAESGINDVSQVLKAQQGKVIIPKKTCDPSANFMGTTLTNTLGGASSGVSYTCVLVNPLSNKVELQNLEPMKSKVVLLHSVTDDGLSDRAMQRFTIFWSSGSTDSKTNYDDTTCMKAGINQRSLPAKCPYATLRLDILRLAAGGVASDYTNADDLQKNTVTIFIYPKTSEAPYTSFSGVVDGKNSPSAVTTVKPINWLGGGTLPIDRKVGISGSGCTALHRMCGGSLALSGDAQTSQFLVRITPLYTDAAWLKIFGYFGPNDNTDETKFTGQQASIDVTGKAKDVMRRVQVQARISGYSNENIPLGAIESKTDVCKNFTLQSGGGTFGQNLCAQ